MKYQNVCIEALGYALPETIVTSEELEARLEPLYRRLRLPQGRLELITGIRQRRFWAPGTLPSEKSVHSAAAALELAGIDKRHVGALIHASVCRDYLEPATACGVHHRLELPAQCLIYDVSNACLGILDGMVQLANMIELGQIRAGIVVGTESSRPLVETTIDALNADLSLTREQVKLAVASLTIGSGSAAVLLTDRALSRTGNRLLAATARAHTAGHALCHSGRDESVAGNMRPLMATDSEQLMREGIAIGTATFDAFLEETGWSRDQIDKTFCHQVGATHRKRMLASLALDPAIDFATFETLGNTGSAALPLSLALGIEQGHLKPHDHAALLGIGSGINSLMLAVDWQCSLVAEHAQPALAPREKLAPSKPATLAAAGR
jgi:3-oxoacyl-[acyl-carrier-protein] synthase III